MRRLGTHFNIRLEASVDDIEQIADHVVKKLDDCANYEQSKVYTNKDDISGRVYLKFVKD